VGALGLVELERAAHEVQHVVGDAARIAALESRVVLDADARQEGDLLASQAGHAPVAAERGQAGALRGDLRPAGRQELADLVGVAHATPQGTPAPSGVGGTGSTPITRAFLDVSSGGWMVATDRHEY
jgi:hypothetical protein